MTTLEMLNADIDFYETNVFAYMGRLKLLLSGTFNAIDAIRATADLRSAQAHLDSLKDSLALELAVIA